jgi:hypothetical protein
MKIEKTASSYPVSIFIAGEYYAASRICRDFCDEVGLCVTLREAEYIYTDGVEIGVIVGLINYPRFPSDPREIINRALALADRLREELGQESYSIQTPEQTIWRSWRAADNADAPTPGNPTGEDVDG